MSKEEDHGFDDILAELNKEPHMKFMLGYTRQDETAKKLIVAIGYAMGRHPQLRLGQLIYAALAKHYNQEVKDIDDTLFSIFDEELLKALDEF